MLKNAMKKFVIWDILKGERGFSFLTSLFTLTVIIISLPFMIHFIKLIEQRPIKTDIEVMNFFLLVRNELIFAEDVVIKTKGKNKSIHYPINQFETASINKYDTIIRRQVNGLGHEIYLREVKEFSVQLNDETMIIQVETINGETYEKQIRFY